MATHETNTPDIVPLHTLGNHADESQDPFNIVAKTEEEQLLHEAIGSLPPRHQDAIDLRFGFDHPDEEELPLAEDKEGRLDRVRSRSAIGEIMGVSGVRVRQYEETAIDALNRHRHIARERRAHDNHLR